VEPDGITFRRWQDGDSIGFTKLVPEFRDTYGAPYYVVHRAHFHEALHQLALKLGITIRLKAKVTEFNESIPSVALTDGTSVTADLVIAADGECSSFTSFFVDLLILHQVSSLWHGNSFLEKRTSSRHITDSLHTEQLSMLRR
jgi:2-polyprenyl-6-methoxyphenol hydroxylase-like FAD-dependent oxidoreductase